MLPKNLAPVQTMKHSGNAVDFLIATILDEWRSKLTPTMDILKRSFGVLTTKRTMTTPASVMWVLKIQDFGLVKLCIGWEAVEHPLDGGKPQTGYNARPCNPKSLLPVVMPSPSPASSPAAALR